MSRNASGTYSLPGGNPVITGTTIASSWANNTMSDIATEMTDSLSRSAKGGMLAQLALIDGTVAAPGVAFSSELGSGLFRAAAGDVQLSVLGTAVGKFKDRIELFSKLAAGDAGIDLAVQSINTRTAGSLFKVSNNATERFRIGFDGKIYKNGVEFTAASWDISFKTADQAESTATMVDLTGITFAAAANTKYAIRILLYHKMSDDSTDGGYSYQVKAAGAPTVNRLRLSAYNENPVSAVQGANLSGTGSAIAPGNFDAALGGESQFYFIHGVLETGASSGTFQLQFQKTGGGAANPTVIAGSYIEWRVIA